MFGSSELTFFQEMWKYARQIGKFSSLPWTASVCQLVGKHGSRPIFGIQIQSSPHPCRTLCNVKKNRNWSCSNLFRPEFSDSQRWEIIVKLHDTTCHLKNGPAKTQRNSFLVESGNFYFYSCSLLHILFLFFQTQWTLCMIFRRWRSQRRFQNSGLLNSWTDHAFDCSSCGDCDSHSSVYVSFKIV